MKTPEELKEDIEKWKFRHDLLESVLASYIQKDKEMTHQEAVTIVRALCEEELWLKKMRHRYAYVDTK